MNLEVFLLFKNSHKQDQSILIYTTIATRY